MPSATAYKLLEACREPGCPVCRLEQRGVERYLDNQFYENVNSRKWRDQLRASHGFCHEHAWLGVSRRLGDALGFSIIYRDILTSVLSQLSGGTSPVPVPRRASKPLSLRELIGNMLIAFTPRKRCPACEHLDKVTRNILSELAKDLENAEMTDALQASDGLCLPHLRLALDHVKSVSICEKLLAIHREKLERLQNELGEFIRKNDYQLIREGFGREGDAWLRAISMITGSRKEK